MEFCQSEKVGTLQILCHKTQHRSELCHCHRAVFGALFLPAPWARNRRFPLETDELWPIKSLNDLFKTFYQRTALHVPVNLTSQLPQQGSDQRHQGYSSAYFLWYFFYVILQNVLCTVCWKIGMFSYTGPLSLMVFHLIEKCVKRSWVNFDFDQDTFCVVYVARLRQSHGLT